MIVTGDYLARGTSVELLSINGTRVCALPDLTDKRWYHSQNGLITCGGGRQFYDPTQTSCVTFTAGKWKKTHTLGHSRFGHTGWSSPQGVLLMGGDDHDSGDKTELLRDNGDIKPSFKLNLKRE